MQCTVALYRFYWCVLILNDCNVQVLLLKFGVYQVTESISRADFHIGDEINEEKTSIKPLWILGKTSFITDLWIKRVSVSIDCASCIFYWTFFMDYCVGYMLIWFEYCDGWFSKFLYVIIFQDCVLWWWMFVITDCISQQKILPMDDYILAINSRPKRAASPEY
jgi:hypothetical protein